MKVGAIVPAAGRGERLGGRDKVLAPLGGRPALAWVLDALVRSEVVEAIVVVASEANRTAIESLCRSLPTTVPVAVTRGGAERALSVRAGAETLGAATKFVLVHDAARPLVTPELIRRAVDAVQRHGAVVAAVPVVDTIKQVALDGRVVTTPDRRSLVAVQTPQVFRFDWLWEAYRRAGASLVTATDEAMLLERAGFPVYVFPGDPENLKITTPLDLAVAEFLLARRRSA
ncbi:MAG: 2-C-methyl-D-erythritol 4-phosphate cytidylyltransferase [Thermomicrobium sp.]|nr:2-C-methyl-D-erythritol 4-phosphate cytidylyltransferase [Thermomicrobium sp.]MDW8058878.1 2-C-methyl-D-erythritol 4-phosphate cytidylyltransferase [Thermomicrobium sp.]